MDNEITLTLLQELIHSRYYKTDSERGIAKTFLWLSEEFGELLCDESIFTELLHRATAEKFGFLYVTLGSEPKFFSSYRSEFKLKDDTSAP